MLEGFSERTVIALKLLTKRNDVPYDEYIRRIKKNRIARKVKIADLSHDCDLDRLHVINEDVIKNLKMVYSTGVVQSLSASSRELIREAFRMAKENDVTTAYDPNYTSCFMNSSDTKEYFEEIIDYTDVIFLSLKNDAARLYEFESIDKVIKYFWDRGVKIVVVKSHIDKGYYTGYNGDISFTEFYNTQKAIDTTASGDVFNGGFLYALTNGYAPADAAKFASVVSGLQTQNYGAIQSIPYKENVLEKI